MLYIPVNKFSHNDTSISSIYISHCNGDVLLFTYQGNIFLRILWNNDKVPKDSLRIFLHYDKDSCNRHSSL